MSDKEWKAMYELALERNQAKAELTRLRAKNEALRSALNGMLTYYGMDEDEWSKSTHDAARAALSQEVKP